MMALNSMARPTILILGGYGVFGGRLAHLLGAIEDVQLIIAGRDGSKAEQFCATLPQGFGHRSATLDRDGDLIAALAPLKPDIVVDASGPFQAYGAGLYRVVEAALNLGISYLDLADGAEFVAGIRQFDAAAKARGIFILSGVSSFPVLTCAVIRHLMQGLDKLDSVEGGIAPSPYAGVGQNVIRAIASYAGKPVRLRRNGRDSTGHGLIETRRHIVAAPGRVPLDDVLFSLVDVPDLRAIPELWPEVREVWMGAGPVPEILHRTLSLLSRLVRLRLLPSLVPFAGLFHWAINRLRWGAHRGGMYVAITARDAAGKQIERSWHLLAEGDDGPFIPSMAVEAVVRRVLQGRAPSPGARAATDDLELADYDALFARRTIYTGTRLEADAAPLYREILGSAWRALPPAIRDLHDLKSRLSASGRATIDRGSNPLARLIGALFWFPPAGNDIPVTVTFSAAHGRETWQRDFNGRSFFSTQRAGTGKRRHLIVERFGIFDFDLALAWDGERLSLVPRGWRCLGIPLPARWAPGGPAYERVADGRFRFCVEIGHPLCGRIVRYEGWLVLNEQARPAAASALR
jgi:hypothetical protein